MIPRAILNEHKCIDANCILSGYRGSIAHGTYVPDHIDDKDVMAVCVPDVEWYFGLGSQAFPANGTKEIKKDEWDIVAYEAKKFIFLLAQGNPNVLSMLWLNPKHYIKMTENGHHIVDNRHLFVGRHVYKSFTGYAYSQLHRMTAYTFDGYMGTKRKELVDKFGYDTKNAANLIRLLRMGIEFLKDGELYVEREDASQLLDIKMGLWTLEQVKTESSRPFDHAEDAYIHSTLPKGPDIRGISHLSVEIIRSVLNTRLFEGDLPDEISKLS